MVISQVVGNEGIIHKSKKVKQTEEIADEKEKVQLIASNLAIEKIGNDKKINNEEFQKIVDDAFGRNKAIGTTDDIGYLITVNRTNNLYTIEDSGSVVFARKNDDFPKDTTPGVLDGDGTEESPYLIMSIEDLVAFSYNVNKDSNYSKDKVFALGRSLYFNGKLRSYVNSGSKYELTDYGYIPSETASTTIKELMTTGDGFISIGMPDFLGNFDGKGHFIANIKTKNNSALFFCKRTEGYIKNLGIEGGKFGGILYEHTNNAKLLIENCYNTGMVEGNGGIINFSDGTVTIKNCHNTGNITGDTPVGGIIGHAGLNVTVNNCDNKGNIKGKDHTGGIVGYIDGSATFDNCDNEGNITGEDYAGGIIGYGAGKVTLSNCYNKGSLQGEVNKAAGGIIGATVADADVTNCYNTGNLDSTNCPAGGIIGHANADADVTNCYNTGNITSSSRAGGIMGYGKNAINCYNTGNITSENSLAGGIMGYGSNATNCFNTGKITGSEPAGGIMGYGSNAINCYNTGNIIGENCTGGIIGSGSNGSNATNCFNTGTIIGRSSTPVGGIMGYGSNATNCHNIGDIKMSDPYASLMYEISDGADNTCTYLIKTEGNARAVNAVGKKEDEMKQTMDIGYFVFEIMNKKVYENNTNEQNIKLKYWTIEYGKPVFAK